MARSISLKEEIMDKIMMLFFEARVRVRFLVSTKSRAYAMPVIIPVIIDSAYT